MSIRSVIPKGWVLINCTNDGDMYGSILIDITIKNKMTGKKLKTTIVDPVNHNEVKEILERVINNA